MNRVFRHVPLLAWRWIGASRSNNIVFYVPMRCRRREHIHSPRLSIDDTENELEYASIRSNESEWMRFHPEKPASWYWHKSWNKIRRCCNTSLFIAMKFYDNFTEIWKLAAYRESCRYIYFRGIEISLMDYFDFIRYLHEKVINVINIDVCVIRHFSRLESLDSKSTF